MDAGRKEDATQVSIATLAFTKGNVPSLYTTVLGLQVIVTFDPDCHLVHTSDLLAIGITVMPDLVIPFFYSCFLLGDSPQTSGLCSDKQTLTLDICFTLCGVMS